MGGNYTLATMNDHNFNTFVFKDYKFEMKVPNFIISDDLVYENLTDAIDAVEPNGIIYANANYYTEENMEIDIQKSFTLKNFRNREVTFDGSGEKWFFTIAEGYTVVFDGICFTEGAIKTHATIENYGNLIINNCSFTGFETAEIIYNSMTLNILNSEFSLNSMDKALVWNDATLVIDDVKFSNNVVNIISTVYNNGIAEIVSSNFTENSNGRNGGAIYTTNSLSVKDTVFNENEGKDGGAIYNTGTLNVFNSTFEDNSANGYGGAIFNGNELNIYNSTFNGGFSGKDGGAIYNNYTMTADNSTFAANSATGNGGAIYNNGSLVLTKSFFGVNYADECANIYNAGNIQFSLNTFDFYDVILVVPDGQYGIPTTITGTLNPEFNMNIQVTLPGFVNNKDATVTISDGVFEYVTDILPKGVYDVRLSEIIYDSYGNIYYGELISDRLIINKANVTINLTVDDVVLHGAPVAPVLKISASRNGTFYILFNNKFSNVTTADGHATLTLDTVGEGNYSVMVVREGDENYNDAVNTTRFKVSEYEGNFIVNSTGNKFDTLREAIEHSSNDDVIYVREGNYSGADNFGQLIDGKKLSIISLGDVVFIANSTDLSFLHVRKTSDVTICDVVFTGFNNKHGSVISNYGNLTVDGCIFINNAADGPNIIYNEGNLSIVNSGFYNNILNSSIILSSSDYLVLINESIFENNTVNSDRLISISYAKSAKVISNAFVANNIDSFSIILVSNCEDVLISSAFYNNTQSGNAITTFGITNLLVNDSIFIGNTMDYIINSQSSDQTTISGCTFTDNTVKNVVLSEDKNLSVLESTFSNNTLSEYGALRISLLMNATVNGSVFTNNKANKYRNIYSVCDVNITNSVFDVLNIDYSVYDIDYGQIETIEGSIDIGTNLDFTVNLDFNAKSYSVNVTDSKFTYNSGIFTGGDYKVTINSKDNNSNTYLFDKITKMFTVNPVDPGLNVSIANITQGEKLKVNLTINENATTNVVYVLNGIMYTKNQLENLTLNHGNYLVTAMYRGDKSFLPSTVWAYVEVRKVNPNITVSDMVINYNDKIEINVSVDVADYYTVFLGNESITLYVKDNATFTFPSEGFKPDIYEIIVYVFETDDYAEKYANATLTVNKAIVVFNLTSDEITYGENATIDVVEVPLNAYGNITYRVYDEDMNLVYNITQSCLEELVIPNFGVGRYNVTGTFEGDIYYSNASKINSSVIIVNTKAVGLNITVSNITYEENATVYLEAEVDGEYLVYVGKEQFVVTVIGGAGNVSVSNLTVGSYDANVTIINGNYSAFNETVFEVTPKSISLVVYVEDIVYGEDAIVNIVAEVDGEYLLELYNQKYTVNVTDGKGNITFANLFVDEDILVSVSIVDGNYSAYNTTTFNVVPKPVPVIIVVGNITYGDDTVVVVQAGLDGEYIVNIRDVNYNLTVSGGDGVLFIPNLGAGEDILASVSIADGNYSAYNTTTFNVVPKPISVIISIGNITYGESAAVIVNADVDGVYWGYIDDDPYIVSVIKGIGSFAVDGLTVGRHVASVFVLDGNYSGFNSTSFDVAVRPYNISISVDNITYGENATVNVTLPDDATGTVTIGNDTVDVINGTASAVLTNLPIGNNTIPIIYSGDKKYTPIETNVTVVVIDPSDIISAPDVTKYYHGSERFVVTVTDYLGNPIAKKSVAVVINGMTYSRTTNANGTTSVALNLGSGVYDATTTVDNTTINSVITILPTVNGTDLVKVFRNNTQYYATFRDTEGNYLTEGTTVKFNINGVMYERKVVGDKGLAKLNINLQQGEYIITAMNPETGEMASNNIKVIPRIVENNDLTKYYRNASQYTVKLIGDDGNPVGAGENVTFNINGVFYTRTTNASGIAKLNINLNPGDYIVTAEYKECKVSNNIKVLPTLTGKDLTKKYDQDAAFEATLVTEQGKPYPGQNISFNINGVFYTKTTDDNGIAKLNINLLPGKYIITSRYDQAAVSNNITVTA
ncbi:MAG: hypothetical protein K6A34_05175 [Methanobrevibacter sp.]|nr:hypothetical protein [Methanobrevibacter sp.]